MKAFFTENLRLKLVSLLLAVMLELYFYSPDNSVTEVMMVDVTVRNLPTSVIIVEPPSSSLRAQVTVRGPAPLVEQAKTMTNRLVVDLPSPVPATHKVHLRRQLRLPPGVELLDITPQTVDLRFERLIQKELKIRVEHSGEPAEGYRLIDARSIPPTVIITGLESVLRETDFITTELVDISTFTASRQIQIALTTNESYTDYEADVVTVAFRIEPQRDELSFESLPIVVKAPVGYAAWVEPAKANILITGPVLALRKVGTPRLIADASNLTAGVHQLALSAELPDGVTIINTEPNSVRVTVAEGKK